jgi:predicted O-linked N-acetylglucosamine transferase (SPINDLY family)
MIPKFNSRESALEEVIYNLDYYSAAVENKDIEVIKHLVNVYQKAERTDEEIQRAIYYFKNVEGQVSLSSWSSFITCEVWVMSEEEYKRVCNEGGI